MNGISNGISKRPKATTAPSIRKARQRDLDALLSLEAEGFPTDRFSRAQYMRLLKSKSTDILVLESARQVVGSAILLFRSNSRKAHLYSIVISADHQGRGMGRTLLAACEKHSLRRGCTSLRLEVRADNKPAIRLYEKSGYVTTGSKAGYYADGMNAVTMARVLAS